MTSNNYNTQNLGDSITTLMPRAYLWLWIKAGILLFNRVLQVICIQQLALEILKYHDIIDRQRFCK